MISCRSCGHGADEGSALARPESLDDADEIPERFADSRFVLHVQDDSPDVALVRHVSREFIFTTTG